MTGPERTIAAMNFESTDRLPIMMNGLPWRYVADLTGRDEKSYWDDQVAAHAAAFRIIGVDFCEQLAFPGRVLTENTWSRGELEKWQDPENVARDLEEETSRLQVRAADMEGRRSEIEREICEYQVETQRKLGEECLWFFGMDSHGPAIVGFPYGRYGYEGFSLAVGLYPEVLAEYWKAGGEVARIHNECVVEAAATLKWPRIGYLGCDMTTQTGNMISPRAMDLLYFPHLRHFEQANDVDASGIILDNCCWERRFHREALKRLRFRGVRFGVFITRQAIQDYTHYVELGLTDADVVQVRDNLASVGLFHPAVESPNLWGLINPYL